VAMKACQVCGYSGTPGGMELHHIVPVEVSEQAGIPESQTFWLCPSCHREVHSWYNSKVARSTYDLKDKRFRPMSSLELVREYTATFSSFLNYKGNNPRINLDIDP